MNHELWMVGISFILTVSGFFLVYRTDEEDPLMFIAVTIGMTSMIMGVLYFIFWINLLIMKLGT